MSKQDKSSTNHKIDRKWVREDKRVFSEYFGVPQSDVPGEEETWLELTEFYREDLKWLLSLEHHIFWSHMIYSEKPQQLLISFLKRSPPNFLKNRLLLRESSKNLLKEVERLVFLVFLRLSTEKESESCYIRNFGEVIYNKYLFTVPIILDICLIYGTTNPDLVRKIINNVITSAPDFLDDFQEIVPHFGYVLKTVKDKFSQPSQAKDKFSQPSQAKDKLKDLKANEAEDLVLYLYDSVATIQVFFEMYPNVCQLFSRSELISEIVSFYSNTLPEVIDCCKKKIPSNGNFQISDLIDDVRIDMLKIVKSIFNFVSNEASEVLRKKEEILNEYLNLMMLLLAEPVFLVDYNQMYSIEFELRNTFENYHTVNSLKVNTILDGIKEAIQENETVVGENFTSVETNDAKVKINSLITEVKDIFPHLEENFIREYLRYYNNNTEKVIAAILENIVPPDMNQSEKKATISDGVEEFKGKHKTKHKSLNEMLDDREEINKMKERYMHLSLVPDETYDDEYDDTYDNLDVAIRDGEEAGRRPFVVPRVLKNKEESEEEEEDEVEEDEEESVVNLKRDQFVENPALLREQMDQRRWEQNMRSVRGRARGQGQSNQVLRNREFKEFHKSSIANHNRKKQAARKMNRGIIQT